MFKRVVWIILDSVGIGALPDAGKFGDEGADTLGSVFSKINNFDLPSMRKIGLGNIDETPKIKPVDSPIGIYGKSNEVSMGKDTTVGHWEMTGIKTETPFPTYPNGFPKDIIDKFIEKTNIPGIIYNQVGSGTDILKQYGREHIDTRKPIVYTSTDSVFQIACHEEVYSIEELYQMCKVAREILVGEHQVARVIARPFVEEKGEFKRTSNRRDFSIEPKDGNLLDLLKKNGISVVGIGKISDIFCGKGITKSIHSNDNMNGVDLLLEEMSKTKEGLIFVNLVDFDSKWGHRRDVEAYGNGLKEFDNRLSEIMEILEEDDLLIINSDHGCDPAFKGTDHTREYIPVLMYGPKANKNVNLHVLDTFADIGQTIAEIFDVKLDMGTSRLEEIWKSSII